MISIHDSENSYFVRNFKYKFSERRTKYYSHYALQYMPFTVLHSMHFTVCTSQNALQSMHFTECTSQYALHRLHFTLCTSDYVFLSMHFT